MKKLMIAAAIVCAAVVSQGANAVWNWKSTGMAGAGQIYGSNGSALAEGTMMYLFDATVAQQDVLDAFRTDKDISDFTPVKTTELTSGHTISELGPEGTGFAYGSDTGSYAFWFASIVGDEILISATTTTLPGTQPSATDISFAATKGWSNTAAKGMDVNFATGGQGWYAAAVPEPTSGLLLLLGVAGLALRRGRRS